MNNSLVRDQIATYFNKGELQNLCYDLHVNYENLPGETLEEKARELIEYCRRHNLQSKLLDRCQELRPHVNWIWLDTIPETPTNERPLSSPTKAHSQNIITEDKVTNRVLLDDITPPGGTVHLNDKLYVERSYDKSLKRNILRQRAITTIRAPRQAGKSSLLLRGTDYARQNGITVVSIDMQEATDRWVLQSFDEFLREFAKTVAGELFLELEPINEIWQRSLLPKVKLTKVFQEFILPEVGDLLVLGLDEIDCLLNVNMHTEFFSLLRAWHNKGANGGVWERLNIVLCISTEPHLLIDDPHQSPFNVGLKLYLKDFSESDVRKLNIQHGNPIPDQAIPDFMNLLQGHPYLVRQALYQLVTENLSWANFHKSAATKYDLFGNHLQRHLELVRADPNLAKAMKRVIRHQKSDDEFSLFRLLKAGLIKGHGNEYVCRCDLYRQYFSKKL